MSHSRIFQMGKAPIDPEEFIDEFDLCECTSFIGPITDSISNNCERKVDFGELGNLLRNVAGDTFTMNYADDASENPEAFIIFRRGFKEAYFRERLKAFKKITDAMTLYEFMSGTHQTWLVEETISERFGYYIYDENGYPMRLDSFLRKLPNDEEIKYCLGCVDSHFLERLLLRIFVIQGSIRRRLLEASEEKLTKNGGNIAQNDFQEMTVDTPVFRFWQLGLT